MINRPKHLILEAVGKFQYLSAFQLARLQFSPTSLTYVQANAAELVKEEYLTLLPLPNLGPKGRPRAFYCLTPKGYRYLEDPSLPEPPKFKDSKEPFRNALFLKHTEESNDLVILTHNLPRTVCICHPLSPPSLPHSDRFTLSRSYSEAQLKKRRVSVKPDGWVELQGTKPAAIAFEMDRATEGREKWKDKIKAYSPYIRGGYQQDFDSQVLTIATVTTSQRRLLDLLNWTREALQEVNDFSMAQILYFASFNPVETSPAQAFLSPIWVTPDDHRRQPLLPGDIFD